MTGLIVIAAWRIDAGCPSCTRVGEASALRARSDDAGNGLRGGVDVVTRRGTTARLLQLAAAGTFGGFLTGLFGVGGGFVIVPALALVLRYSMPQAIGTSLVVIAVNTAMAFAARLGGSIDWGTTLLFTRSRDRRCRRRDPRRRSHRTADDATVVRGAARRRGALHGRQGGHRHLVTAGGRSATWRPGSRRRAPGVGARPSSGGAPGTSPSPPPRRGARRSP